MDYKLLLLLPATVLVTFGIILVATTTTETIVAVDVNDSTAILTITTHQPWCTALELNHLNITRLTDVYPYYKDGMFGYDRDELRNGINITAVIWKQDFNMISLDLLEQPEVTNVAMHSLIVQNATTSMVLVEEIANHNATWRGDYISYCGDAVDINTLMLMLDLMGLEGAEPGTEPRGIPPSNRTELEMGGASGASGAEPGPLKLDPRPDGIPDPESRIYYHGDLVFVSITTYGNAATDIWRYLKDNGAIVFDVNYDENVDEIGAYVPPSILWHLSTMDNIRKIIPIEPGHTEHYGDINTDGLSLRVHPYVEHYHHLGYDGTGVKVGVIDNYFNLVTTTENDLPPLADITCYRGCDPDSDIYNNIWSGVHGTDHSQQIVM